MSEFDGYINKLLAVEKEAENLVRDAEVKADHIKEEASYKAKERIDKLRTDMERDFQANKIDNTQMYTDSKSNTEGLVSKDTGLYTKNKDTVIDLLVERTMNVRYELPRNIKRDYSELIGHTL